MAEESISRIITRLAAEDPDRPAITHEGATITRREFDLSTNRLARAYAEMGVGQDDMVTLALPNSIEFYQAAFATWKLGATPQPVSARLPQIEREAIVGLANPALVVGAEPGSLGDRIVIPSGYEPDPTLSDELLPDRIASYWKAPTSGGSTGRPKIIVAKARGAFEFGAMLPLRQERNRTQLVPGPLYHNAPFSFSAQGLLLGNHIVVMTRFDASEALRLIEKHRVDWTVMVPTMMLRIWRLPIAERTRHDLSSLRILLHLAAPCPAWLKEAWIEWLGPQVIHELFAGTEATGVTWITGEEWLEHRGSVGRMMGGNIRIVDDAGNDLPPGQVGEIYMLPPGGQGSTYHYIGADSKAIDGGWESLGDMGYLDTEGYLYLSDRKSDMILSGGANIYPAEVEAAIEAHPSVRSSAVIGLPDDDMGQVVHAIVDATVRVSEEELLAFLAERLVRYKLPRSIEFVTEPLRDDAGKSRRAALLAERVPRIERARP